MSDFEVFPTQPSPVTKGSSTSTRRLTALYIVSLSAIAGLSIWGQLRVQQALNQQVLDLQVVSAAQNQQINSQRLVKATLAFKLPARTEEQQERTAELEDAIQAAETWQQALSTLQTSPDLSPERQKEVQQMVTQLSPQYQLLLDTAKQTLATVSSNGAHPGIRQTLQSMRSFTELLATEKAFIQDMDALVLEYNQRIAAEANQLKRLEQGLLLLTLAMLFLEGYWVFRPAVREIQKTLTALAKSLRETQEAADRLSIEQQKSEKLLLNILPQPIAQRLKQKPEAIADGFTDVTVLFADIVDFTRLSATMPPQQLVALLNSIFSTFDQLAEKHNLEKIKTIGDAYMAVGGLPIHHPDHAKAVINFALDMQHAIKVFNSEQGESFQIRIGINSGPVVAGVIGIKKFIYDLWGDTVNIASRMESQGIPGSIQITESTFQHVKGQFQFKSLGTISVKGKGNMMTYQVIGQREKAYSTTGIERSEKR